MAFKVDLTSLKNATASLDLAIQQPFDEFLRDSVIQRFEYTFELCWKTLKRYFDWNQGLQESNVKNILREAGKQGLIDDVELWFSFHKARNETSHTYNKQKAEEIYKIALQFNPRAQALVKKLSELMA